MDGQRFDDLTRAVAATLSRRRALRTLGGAVAGAALAAVGWGRSGAASCREAGSLCSGDGNCCSLRCDTTNSAPFKRNRCVCPPDKPENCRGVCKNPATDYLADPLNCAGCARRCPPVLHGNATCAAAVCDFVCVPGYQRCAGGCVLADGCCIEGAFVAGGAINPANPCQACRPAVTATAWSNDDTLTCPLPQATGGCQAGVCATIVACDEGFGNCGGGVADGCERPLTTNSDCGACNRACHPGEQCVGGQCRCGDGAGCLPVEQCVEGACMCGSLPGCPQSFPNATVTCDPIAPIGRCRFDCVAGYGDCDGILENGCERALLGCASCEPCDLPNECCRGECVHRCSGFMHKCCPTRFDPEACPEIIGEEPESCPVDVRGQFTRYF